LIFHVFDAPDFEECPPAGFFGRHARFEVLGDEKIDIGSELFIELAFGITTV
jgi:hypothetical protein